MKQLFLIAQDERVWDENHEPTIETRICFNFGAYKTQKAAQACCDKQNQDLPDDDEGIMAEYFVQPINLN